MGRNSMTTQDLHKLYRQLHSNPELSGQEKETSALMATVLQQMGFTLETRIGGYGLAGQISRGDGPTVMLRAEMDGLPVREATGVPFASSKFIVQAGQQIPTMHACGHDIHMTALIGAAQRLLNDDSWTGRLLVVFQPAEEVGTGAQAMLDDGFLERVGTPDVVLGQHVTAFPVGWIGAHEGPAFASSETIRITIVGKGGHGSRPELTVDPIVIASAIVLRAESIVARELSTFDPATLTATKISAGTAGNVTPDSAELVFNLRTFNESHRDRMIEALQRICVAEARAAGAEIRPTFDHTHSFPVLSNDPTATAAINSALATVPGSRLFDPGRTMMSEDFGNFATAAGAQSVFWQVGCLQPKRGGTTGSVDEWLAELPEHPANHSAEFLPMYPATLEICTEALVVSALRMFRPPIGQD